MATSRYGTVFFAAVLVAAGATYAVYRTVEATKASARIVTVPVVVATRDITEGQNIDRLALTVAQWPQPTVPAGAFGSIDSVAGRVAKVNIFNGEPIVPGRLAPVGTGPGIEVKITPGKRALSFRVNDVTSVSGMIQPNSRVDVLLTLNQAGDGGRRAITFMPNMRVLAMGTQIDRGADGRPIQTSVATVEVTPDEAEKLLVAQTQGQIQLALRGYGDPDSVDTKGATIADVEALLRQGGAPARVAPPPARRPRPEPAAQPAAQPAPAPAPVAAQAPPPVRPDSYAVKVIRGRNTEERRFAKDSVKRDTIPF